MGEHRAAARANARLRASERELRRQIRELRAEGRAKPLARVTMQLGSHLLHAGRYAEAAAILKRAVRLVESAFGRNSVAVVRPLNDLGVCYKFLARFPEAGQVYQRALYILEGRVGREHPDVATLYHNLGGLEHAAGNPMRGEPFGREGLRIRIHCCGRRHPDVAADMAALAALLDQQKKYAEAEALYRQALAIYEEVYGPEHPAVAASLNNLAALEQARLRAPSSANSGKLQCIYSEIVRSRLTTTVALAAVCAAAACSTQPRDDYAARIAAERELKDQSFAALGRNSPIRREDVGKFLPLAYFPIDESYAVPAQLHPLKQRVQFTMPTSTGTLRNVERVGTLRFNLKGQPLQLTAFLEEGSTQLFVPFSDLTSGTETYQAGRYMNLAPTASGIYIVDFNAAFNPYCYYNVEYECPIPPTENRLKVPVRAGERMRDGDETVSR